MPKLFSYGTLRDIRVQLALFGRPLAGEPDAITGFALGRVPVADAEDAELTGLSHYQNLESTGVPADRVSGVIFEITEGELQEADAYEAPAGYRRELRVLASGQEAWVFRRPP